MNMKMLNWLMAAGLVATLAVGCTGRSVVGVGDETLTGAAGAGGSAGNDDASVSDGAAGSGDASDAKADGALDSGDANDAKSDGIVDGPKADAVGG